MVLLLNLQYFIVFVLRFILFFLLAYLEYQVCLKHIEVRKAVKLCAFGKKHDKLVQNNRQLCRYVCVSEHGDL